MRQMQGGQGSFCEIPFFILPQAYNLKGYSRDWKFDKEKITDRNIILNKEGRITTGACRDAHTIIYKINFIGLYKF